MTQKRETGLVRRMKVAMEKEGACVSKLHGSAMSVVGDPDLYACFEGYAVLVEAKHPQERTPVAPAQHYRMGMWRKAGARVGVAKSVEDALNIMRGKDV